MIKPIINSLYSQNTRKNKLLVEDYIIGGQVASTEEFPFLVAWHPFRKHTFSCTGVLITSTFVLSASHCLRIFRRKDVELAKRECVNQTHTKGFYVEKQGIRLHCKTLAHGDIEITSKPSGRVWLGINDPGVLLDASDSYNKQYIKRYIYHKHSYSGRQLFSYGGYDILLIQLQKATSFKTACLPGPNFDDIRIDKKDTIIAGYGKYIRNLNKICQTNRFGMMKFHYCDQKFGIGNTACDISKPPPTGTECKHFFNNPKTPNTVPANMEEIRIIYPNSSTNIFCYPSKNPEDHKFGWCW